MADSTLTDPLGREITLHERTWTAHIISGHPEVSGHRLLVEPAVTSPTEIRRSKSDPDCRLYFGPGPRPAVIIMLVADVARGVVKTAHFARRITGGPTEWSSPTR